MTQATDNEVARDMDRIDATAAKRDAGKLIANGEPSTANAVCNEPDQNRTPLSNPAPSQAAPLSPLRVLVVEDDLTIGPLLAEVLGDLGHVVCALEVNASAAVSAAKRCHPDLMIVDIDLGDTSGIAAVKEILEQGFVPHVFVTGDALRGLPLGPDAVLIQKPYRSSDLVAAIAKATEDRTKRDQFSLA